MPNLRQFIVLIVFFCLVAPAGKGFFSDVQAAEQASPPKKTNPVSALSLAISTSLISPANPVSSVAPASSVSAASPASPAIKASPASPANPATSVAPVIPASAVSPATPASVASPANPASKVSTRPASALPGQDEFYDPANPDYHKLQKANESLAGFLLDKKQYVNWMDVLRKKLITPRADLAGKTTMEVLDLDILMKNTKAMPYVKFPHNSHTMWLACSNCHEQIFVKKAGANKIDMAKIFRGQYCGVCHDKVSFSMFFSCETCHSVPQAGAKPWWN